MKTSTTSRGSPNGTAHKPARSEPNEREAMMINTNAIVSASEANQNFSRVTRIADAQGQAVIFKNNKPKYLLVDIESTPYFDMTDDEKIDVIAARILKKFKPAFEELAK